MADGDERTMTLKDQIMEYIEKIVNKLTESQAQSILAMLARFYGRNGG